MADCKLCGDKEIKTERGRFYNGKSHTATHHPARRRSRHRSPRANGVPSATVRMGIGANGSAGFDADGTYYPFEILMFNQYLGDTDRQKIEGYLAWKWGLQTSLPVGHPYKSAAP